MASRKAFFPTFLSTISFSKIETKSDNVRMSDYFQSLGGWRQKNAAAVEIEGF